MSKYILGSHNSWSYLKPRKWWMRLIVFTARCQSVTIIEQYTLHDVRCFDLRVRWDNDGNLTVAHGIVEYKYTWDMLMNDLTFLNTRGDCCVRVLHETRNKKQHTRYSFFRFRYFCRTVVERFSNKEQRTI